MAYQKEQQLSETKICDLAPSVRQSLCMHLLLCCNLINYQNYNDRSPNGGPVRARLVLYARTHAPAREGAHTHTHAHTHTTHTGQPRGTQRTPDPARAEPTNPGTPTAKRGPTPPQAPQGPKGGNVRAHAHTNMQGLGSLAEPITHQTLIHSLATLASNP